MDIPSSILHTRARVLIFFLFLLIFPNEFFGKDLLFYDS